MAARTADVVEIRSQRPDRYAAEILAAATADFRAHGFGGARIEAIAERAPASTRSSSTTTSRQGQLFLAVLEQPTRHPR
jgi:AcrR family transcriptional regulator